MASRPFLSDLSAATLREALHYDAETGIFTDLRSWIARIQVNKTRREYGGFVTPEAARDKYIEEARRDFGVFARAE